MKFFLDTAQVSEIRELSKTGMVDGITTNPSLIVKSGRPLAEVISEICSIVDGPVSVEVAATDTEVMIQEAHKLLSIASHVVVKLPLTWDGLKACHALTDEGHAVNMTLCFSVGQALLAAKAGATFVSPFIGRLDDINLDGVQLIRDIREVYGNYGFNTEVLVASVRSINHVSEAALTGADVITLPPSILRDLASHPLTDKGLDAFLRDWRSTGQSIL